jgi:hypothetical protein
LARRSACKCHAGLLLTILKGDEGYLIADNLRKMRNNSASKICALIVALYFDLVQEREKEKTDPP